VIQRWFPKKAFYTWGNVLTDKPERGQGSMGLRGITRREKEKNRQRAENLRGGREEEEIKMTKPAFRAGPPPV